jgi:hypothetical protein
MCATMPGSLCVFSLSYLMYLWTCTLWNRYNYYWFLLEETEGLEVQKLAPDHTASMLKLNPGSCAMDYSALTRHLWSIYHRAARLIFSSRKSDHITALFQSLSSFPWNLEWNPHSLGLISLPQLICHHFPCSCHPSGTELHLSLDCTPTFFLLDPS